MPSRNLDANLLGRNEDWVGNNVAFRCPECDKVFIVSDHIHKGQRECPACGKSVGRVKGGKESGGEASLEWPMST